MTAPTILIVDDEEPIRALLQRILETAGYRVLQAGESSQARKRLEGREIDLLLCDVMMPGESGVDLIRFVKEEYPDTGIVMVTAVDDQETARAILEVGVYGYKEIALRDRAEELQEFNSALRVLLKQREEDKAALEQNVLSHMEHIVLPHVEKIKGSGLNVEQRSLVQALETSLHDLTSPMAKTLTSRTLDLTPTELQVADLIKHGKRTKEIAEMLHLSTNTIISHRYNIRTKLDLKNRKINLRSYLQSLQP